jgi:ABC-type lipoprotein export system ATPase subunit
MVDIKAVKLQHHYLEKNKEHTILDELDIHIPSNQTVCIMGASGSGKSTLLHILSGLLKPSNGKVIYNETDLTQLSLRALEKLRLQSMGFMFQKQHFFPELSIIENIELPLRIQKRAERDLVYEIADIMKLDKGLYNRYPHQLSGGEQARAGLARALVHKPKIVFADEPTSALDDTLTHEIFKDIESLRQKLGFSMVIASHDHSLLEYFDDIYYLKNGQLEKLDG